LITDSGIQCINAGARRERVVRVFAKPNRQPHLVPTAPPELGRHVRGRVQDVVGPGPRRPVGPRLCSPRVGLDGGAGAEVDGRGHRAGSVVVDAGGLALLSAACFGQLPLHYLCRGSPTDALRLLLGVSVRCWRDARALIVSRRWRAKISRHSPCVLAARCKQNPDPESKPLGPLASGPMKDKRPKE